MDVLARGAELEAQVREHFEAFALATEFPCLGAHAALRQGKYEFHLYASMTDAGSVDALARDLAGFGGELVTSQETFSTFVASFSVTEPGSEVDFEKSLWKLLNDLHHHDKTGWDQAVSADPADPHFGFSFAGNGYFVVGLNPLSSRVARRFAWPTLCFNAHAQFDELRASGHFEKMRDQTRKRDIALEGSSNPMCADYGETSEARQYSGRQVADNWQCPVHFEEK